MFDVQKFRRTKARECSRFAAAAIDTTDKLFWSMLAEQWLKLDRWSAKRNETPTILWLHIRRLRTSHLIDQLYNSMIEIGRYGKKAIRDIYDGLWSSAAGSPSASP